MLQSVSIESTSDIRYNISTITMSLQIPNCKLNLINIGKYLQIDDNILGIKYNYGKSSILKGKYLTSIYNRSKAKNQNKVNKTLFYNQVSIIVKLSLDKIINVKLFGNGSLHLTGIKHPSDGKAIINLIYDKLLKLRTQFDVILLTKDINNVYLDNENNIYTANSKNRSIIGFKYNDIYNINKKDYTIDSNTGLFISTKYENKRTRTFLNLNGEKIGTSRIELLKNKSKLYKNNSNIHFDYQNGFIYYDGDGKSNIIGKIINEITTQSSLEENNDYSIIEYKYDCNPFLQSSIIYSINEFSKLTDETLQSDINCINIYFKLDFELNRQRLFKELLKLSYITEYKPEKYSGVKLRYKISKTKKLGALGICTCTNKCTCNHITFVIFQSGNIIASGFKSIDSIDNIVNDFNNLIMSLKHIIKMKTFL
jgi:TATA-box binding protein (TBP) (component of TFIID and TFIIIB)